MDSAFLKATYGGTSSEVSINPTSGSRGLRNAQQEIRRFLPKGNEAGWTLEVITPCGRAGYNITYPASGGSSGKGNFVTEIRARWQGGTAASALENALQITQECFRKLS